MLNYYWCYFQYNAEHKSLAFVENLQATGNGLENANLDHMTDSWRGNIALLLYSKSPTLQKNKFTRCLQNNKPLQSVIIIGLLEVDLSP